MSKPSQRATFSERRGGERVLLTRPCKLYHAPSRRYLTASTCDISGVGMLIRLPGPRRLAPGDDVRILVQWNDGEILRHDTAQPARIARALDDGDTQLIGIELALSPMQARHAA